MSADDFLILTALAVIVLVALALLLAGGGLLLTASAMNRTGEGNVQRPLDLLDRQWHFERSLYRHHRIAGTIIIAASAYFLWQVVSEDLLMWSGIGLWQPLLWLLIIGNAFNLAIGIVVTVRPSRLKPLEAVANRWFPVDSRTLGRVLARHPRLRGLLLLAVALVALGGAAVLLVERLQEITGP